MSKKEDRYTIEKETPLREVLEQVRRMNDGKPKQHYCRYRAYYWTRGYVSIEGAEVPMAQAAATMARQIGGRVIRYAATKHSVELDILLPQTVALAKASKLLRKAMSEAYRATKPGAGGSRGYLFKSREIIETLNVMRGTVESEFRIIHSEEEHGRIGATALAMGLDDTEAENDES